MTKERIFFFLFILVLCILTYFSLDFFNPKKIALKEAQSYLKQFKPYKAVEILIEAKKKIKKNDKELDAYIIYALAKAGNFTEAENFFRGLKNFPYLESNDLKDLIKVLSVNNQNQMLAQIITELNYPALDEEFFIKLSSEKNNPEEEMEILDLGLQYLLEMKQYGKKHYKKLSTANIQEYYTSRCIDIGNIFLAQEEYEKAKDYFEKPINRDILDSSSYEDRLYFDLAYTYEKLGDSDKAHELLEMSAKLGNKDAQEVLQNY